MPAFAPEQLMLIAAAILAGGLLNLIIACLILRAVIRSAVISAGRALRADP